MRRTSTRAPPIFDGLPRNALVRRSPLGELLFKFTNFPFEPFGGFLWMEDSFGQVRAKSGHKAEPVFRLRPVPAGAKALRGARVAADTARKILRTGGLLAEVVAQHSVEIALSALHRPIRHDCSRRLGRFSTASWTDEIGWLWKAITSGTNVKAKSQSA
ncbi:hypothetical protein LJR164_001606 [Phenylobacterium sp. LjRoot164]|uniref:hypothetical protein n=1 Tax=unclassified Phenylobacterium TaxID=2640670 RepID=UPI003ED0E0A5